MPNTEILGKRIRQFRKEKGKTQGEFAAALHVSPQAVSNWERGISPPDLENLVRMASFFGVLVDDLFRSGSEDLFLGVDGGGTKTEFVVVSSRGRVLRRLVKEGANPNDVGYAAASRILLEGIEGLMAEFPGISGIFCGVAGITAGDYAQRLTETLTRTYPKRQIGVGSDAINLLSVEDGVEMAVISGTGSVVFVQKENGLTRLGGWGYLLDEGGSAYDLGRDALRVALEEEDFARPVSPLGAAVRAKLGGKTVWEKINAVYDGGKPYIASFASCVFEAYAQGDEGARQIVDKTAKSLARLLREGVRLHHVTPRAVANGGIFAYYGDVLIPLIQRYCNVELIRPDIPPVYGACRKACSEKGILSDEFAENFRNTYGGMIK